MESKFHKTEHRQDTDHVHKHRGKNMNTLGNSNNTRYMRISGKVRHKVHVWSDKSCCHTMNFFIIYGKLLVKGVDLGVTWCLFLSGRGGRSLDK